MKRTKEWWSKFTQEERWKIWNFERYQHHSGGSSYYPDDCSECGVCGNLCLGYSPCTNCLNEYINLVERKGEKSGEGNSLHTGNSL